MNDTEKKKDLSLKETLKILFSASKGFWLVNMVNFGDGICYFGVLVLLTRFLGTEIGMSDKLVGVSVSTFTGLVTLFMFGGGFLTDKLGVRRALTWSLIFILVGRVILTAAPFLGQGAFTNTIVWVGLIIYAFGEGVIQPSLYAGIKEYTDPRTATMGYGILYSIMNLGIVAEHFVSPFIRTDKVFMDLGFSKIVGLGWGINGVFWSLIAITGFMLLVHISFFRKKVEDTCRTVKYEPKKESPKLDLMEKIKSFPLLDSRFLFFIFILLPVRTLFAHQFLTMPDYIFRAFSEGVSAKWEWINGLNPLIIVIFVPTIAAMTRKIRVIDMMIVGTTISALTTFFLVPSPNLSFLLTYVIIFSLGEAVWSSRFLEYVANIAPAGRVGAYMGLAGIPWFMAKATTGWYSGFMLDKFVPAGGAHDTTALWLIYAFIACISPIGLIIGRRWIVKGEQKKAG